MKHKIVLNPCANCGREKVGDCLTDWCPACTPKEEILRRSLWALQLQISELVKSSTGAKLKRDVDAGMLAKRGGLLKWDDAVHSCWLGALNTARQALRVCGTPEGGA